MLRIVVVLALAFAVLWYMLKDGNQNSQVLQEEAEKVEMAKAAVQSSEAMSAAMAEQTDAIRDAALGREPAAAEGEQH